MQNARFKKFGFKNGKSTQNRVVVPPMASQTANASGFASEATFSHYERLAESGAGLIFVEYTYVHQTGKGEANQLGADSDDNIPSLRRIAEIIQKAGSLAGLQLVHVGGKSTSSLTGAPLMGPSALAVPVKGWEPEVPVAMSEQDIQSWIVWFVAAAKRAEQAGFDFVELHAAHGYGLNQWLSPITNQRTDSYGGSTENRSRLLLKIARAIKEQVPGLLLAVRLPGQDHTVGGLTSEEMTAVVKLLEKNGVDLLDVSSGIGGWRRQGSGTAQGYLVQDASALKAHVSLPVIGVGGIVEGTFIDSLISSGAVDFAAVGRAILKDPRAWGEAHLCCASRLLDRVS